MNYLSVTHSFFAIIKLLFGGLFDQQGAPFCFFWKGDSVNGEFNG